MLSVVFSEESVGISVVRTCVRSNPRYCRKGDAFRADKTCGHATEVNLACGKTWQPAPSQATEKDKKSATQFESYNNKLKYITGVR